MKYSNVLITNPKNKVDMQCVDIYPPNDMSTELLTGEREDRDLVEPDDFSSCDIK